MTASTRRPSTRRALVVFASTGALALAALGIVESPAAPVSPSPGQLVKTAIDAATGQGSVRITVHFFSGTKTGEVVQDSSTDSGIETVAIGKERVSILLSGGTAYLSGNTQGLTSYIGLPAPVATALAGQWISIPPTDSGFKSVVSGLALAAALKEATPAKPLRTGKTKMLLGKQTLSISGTGSTGQDLTTLFVATGDQPLPVEAVASSGSAKSASGEIITFSKWGEAVHVPVPSTSIPISSLGSPAG